MRKRTLLKVFSLSCLSAVFLCALTWTVTQVIEEKDGEEFASGMRLLFARIAETGPPQEGLARLIEYRKDNPLFSSTVWILSEDGTILASAKPGPLPEKYATMAKPVEIHEVRFESNLSVIRLEAPDVRYLLFQSNDPSIFYRSRWVKVVRVFIAFTLAAMTALVLFLLYLRRKSWEARQVLGRLERGDLKARFRIQSLDEIGNLMLHFNRMADEIERLVGQVREVESSRRTMIQELGHDLRTPLMGLQTSLDALVADWQVMQPSHRDQVLRNCKTEIGYFAELVDGLLFIAQMDEPRYKTPTDRLDLYQLLKYQLLLYQAAPACGRTSLRWEIDGEAPKRAFVLGNAQMLSRMIRNLLDNAARFAEHKVTVRVSELEDQICLSIEDDGPGMTEEEIWQYGKVRNRRISQQPTGAQISLGLGSVIVQRVVELHQGCLRIRGKRATTGTEASGTTIEVRFPRSPL